MDFKKHIRRRIKRLRTSFFEPLEQSRAVKKLWALMGAQGVLIHMARQGRWNMWLAFLMALASLGLVLLGIAIMDFFDAPLWAWVFMSVPAFLSSFVHLALWRSASHRKGVMAFIMKLYTIPMMGLMFCMFVGIVVVSIQQGLEGFSQAIQSSTARMK